MKLIKITSLSAPVHCVTRTCTPAAIAVPAQTARAIGLMALCLVWWLVLCFALFLSTTSVAFSADEKPSAINSEDAIVFIRHALAPGTGDPVDFDVDDCATQRNLSAQGRQQSADIGNRLRELGFDGVPVYTSAWCRCRDTAELMASGPVEVQPLLNSFFATPSDGPQQLEQLADWLATVEKPVVLVTHQVVITGMTNVYPTSGEMVIVNLEDGGELQVIDTIETDIR
jgi:phosphohistidine phosphatase SixA